MSKVAYHEAGHAVAGVLIGRKIARVWLKKGSRGSDLHQRWVKLEPEDPEVSREIRLLEQELVRRGRLDVLLRDGVQGLQEEDPEAQVIAALRKLPTGEE
jgi:hypothetical protein